MTQAIEGLPAAVSVSPDVFLLVSFSKPIKLSLRWHRAGSVLLLSLAHAIHITNECGAFWKGILVEGNPALQQRPNSNQGVAEVKHGAVIEHARVEFL